MRLAKIGLRLPALALAMLAVTLTTGSHIALADGATSGADCGACRAAAQSLAVDPASYKQWPSGARTLLNVVWSQAGSSASFNLVNGGQAATPALSVMVVVDNHDPLSQTSSGATTYSYAVAALAPQTFSSVTVPLDYRQCDVYLTVDTGNGSPSVFRTGNPAAC